MTQRTQHLSVFFLLCTWTLVSSTGLRCRNSVGLQKGVILSALGVDLLPSGKCVEDPDIVSLASEFNGGSSVSDFPLKESSLHSASRSSSSRRVGNPQIQETASVQPTEGQDKGGSNIHVVIEVDTSAVLSRISGPFICATLDWWPPEKCDYGRCAWDHASMLNLNLKHPVLRSMVKALSPFLLRLGGSLQDGITYSVGDQTEGDEDDTSAAANSDKSTGAAATSETSSATSAAGHSYGAEAESPKSGGKKRTKVRNQKSTKDSTGMAHNSNRRRKLRGSRWKGPGEGSAEDRGENFEGEDKDSRKQECPPFQRDKSSRVGFRGGCLNGSRWIEINHFCLDMGCEIAFGLNALTGRTFHAASREWQGSWDSSNARSLIEFTAARSFPVVAWELGNELTGSSGVAAAISPGQYAADTWQLLNVLDDVYSANSRTSSCTAREGQRAKYGFCRPLVVAPDSYFDPEWTAEFLTKLKPRGVDVITRHIYYLGAGVDPAVEQRVLSPDSLNSELPNYQQAWDVVRENAQPGTQVWVGESGGAYNSGRHGVTDSFMSGFWYSDQLGMAAANHHTMFCRQTLIGGNYGLLNTTTFHPNPDFFSALLWHRLMLPEVLSARLLLEGWPGTGAEAEGATGSEGRREESDIDGKDAKDGGEENVGVGNEGERSFLRVYVHGRGIEDGTSQALSMLLINLHPSKAFSIRHKNTISSNDCLREEYHLTAPNGDIKSQGILLNGMLLRLEGVTVPPLSPQRMLCHEHTILAPFSYAFLVIEET